MHTFELQHGIRSFLVARDEELQAFYTTVDAFAKGGDPLLGLLDGLAVGGNKLSEAANNIHHHLASMAALVPDMDHRKFYRSLDAFQRHIQDLVRVFGDAGALDDLMAEAELFSKEYGTFVSSQSGKNALPLVVTAQRLRAKLQQTEGLFKLFARDTEADVTPREDEDVLSLWLPGDMDFGEFSAKVDAVRALYAELCMLFDVSEQEHPLRIAKVESGSLWARVIGDTKIVETMAQFVKEGAAYLYRTFTKEGRITTLPRKVEAVDSLLGLTQRMTDAGMNVDEMRPNIEKAAVALSRELSVLLRGQGAVTVNDNTLSVGHGLAKVYLERSTSLLLESAANDSGDEHAPALPPPG